MMFRSQIVGCGAYLPERIVTNEELATRLDTSDAWIRQRTGIGQRRIAADGELTSDLAYHAARQALERAGMNGNDLDLLVLATATPDETFPATAVKVQARLSIRTAASMTFSMSMAARLRRARPAICACRGAKFFVRRCII
jgi:3-oxoacyl-[acyl-carrier-protein] synthase-3